MDRQALLAGSEVERPYWSLLLDHYDDAFDIMDLLADLGLPRVPDVPLPDAVELKLLERLISYINGQLRENPEVVPTELVRFGRFPRIRQMRDVHQFDVGSHLAATVAMSLRLAPIRFLEQRGVTNLSALLGSSMNGSDGRILHQAALMHDFFKPLRPRRKLPEKMGPEKTIQWTLPSGRAGAAITEGGILAEYLNEDEVFDSGARVLAAVAGSDAFGRVCYALLHGRGTIEDLVAEFIRAVPTPTVPAAIYVGMCDAFGKGYASHVVCRRKGHSINLNEALHRVLIELDRLC